MGDSVTGRPDGSPARSGSVPLGSSVLTPPTGLPALAPAMPAQRPPDDLRPAPPRPVVVEPCTCGHARAAHDHYRPGTDCGACGAEGCASYRPVGGPVRKVMRRMGLSE